MTYTIHQLATLANISSRTLRYYDKIGLLKPDSFQKNGYRLYSDKSLLRLQQILFFKELEFCLKEIMRILSDPDFKRLPVLQDQAVLLQLKKQRLQKIIKTINHTIMSMQSYIKLTDQELYDSFDTKEVDAYTEEAKQRWGKTEAYAQSQERTKNYTKDDYKRIHDEGITLTRKIANCMSSGSDSPEVQALIKLHYQSINQFYDCSLEMYLGLGEMYVADERFTSYYEKFADGLALFMKEAIKIYCQSSGK